MLRFLFPTAPLRGLGNDALQAMLMEEIRTTAGDGEYRRHKVSYNI